MPDYISSYLSMQITRRYIFTSILAILAIGVLVALYIVGYNPLVEDISDENISKFLLVLGITISIIALVALEIFLYKLLNRCQIKIIKNLTKTTQLQQDLQAKFAAIQRSMTVSQSEVNAMNCGCSL